MSCCETDDLKEITGFNGFYYISKLGEIHSMDRMVNHGDGIRKRVIKGKILNKSLGSHGYYMVSLSNDGVTKKYLLHQLIAIAYLGHKPDRYKGLIVDHINNIKTDNRIENLQLVTVRENTSKDRKHGISEHRGVTKHKNRNKWIARISDNGKDVYLGSFVLETDAALAVKNYLN